MKILTTLIPSYESRGNSKSLWKRVSLNIFFLQTSLEEDAGDDFPLIREIYIVGRLYHIDSKLLPGSVLKRSCSEYIFFCYNTHTKNTSDGVLFDKVETLQKKRFHCKFFWDFCENPQNGYFCRTPVRACLCWLKDHTDSFEFPVCSRYKKFKKRLTIQS